LEQNRSKNHIQMKKRHVTLPRGCDVPPAVACRTEIPYKNQIFYFMKRFLLILFAFGFTVNLYAQNIQAHYDMGKDRGYLTTTVEMFRPDKMGSTFFFIDMDYGAGDVDGISLAYWEIARSFKIGETALQPRIEYNGGFGQWKDGEFSGHYTINNAYLAGLQYTWNNADFSRILTLQANYKNIQDKNEASFQLTAVWEMHFFKRKFSFSGFADFWKEDNVFGSEKTDYVFLTETQLWYNACEHFSFGSEIEVSSNFSGNKGTMVNPTLAVKWSF